MEAAALGKTNKNIKSFRDTFKKERDLATFPFVRTKYCGIFFMFAFMMFTFPFSVFA